MHPLDFDGHSDALLHPFDGGHYMQYLNDHGSYHDVPAKFLMREMARDDANMQGEDLSSRDMEPEGSGSLNVNRFDISRRHDLRRCCVLGTGLLAPAVGAPQAIIQRLEEALRTSNEKTPLCFVSGLVRRRG